MNADDRRFKHERLTSSIIGILYEVYNELGFRFLESVYREAMMIGCRAARAQSCKIAGKTAGFSQQQKVTPTHAVVGLEQEGSDVRGAISVHLRSSAALGGP